MIDDWKDREKRLMIGREAYQPTTDNQPSAIINPCRCLSIINHQ
jgi:hypothetical protein